MSTKPFADYQPDPPERRVKVIHGANDGIFDGIVGASIASVRDSLFDVFNLPTDAVAFVNGKVVGKRRRLKANDTLEFVARRGHKSALEPDELALLRRMADDIDRIKSVVDRHTEQAPPQSVDHHQLQIDRHNGHAILDGVRYALDPAYLAILDDLLRANGNWRSRADMQRAEPLLRHEERLDRLIKRLKRTHPTLGGLIDSGHRGFRLTSP